MNLSPAGLVHLYTASGAVAALFGTLAVFADRYREAFLWMTVATLVDATDGPLARRFAVRDHMPEVDGSRLDDIVDYVTFVFLPVLLLIRAGLLPPDWGPAVAVVVVLSSALGFAAVDAKSDDHYFTGFPSYWNIVALYLYIGAQQGLLTPVVNAAILLVLSGLVFWRVGYVYPSRTPVLRGTTIGLGVVWGAMVVAMILMLPRVPVALSLASLFFPLYYFILSAVLQQRRRRAIAVGL